MTSPAHTREFLNMLNRASAPKFTDLSTDQARRSFLKLHEYFAESAHPEVVSTDHTFMVRDAAVVPYRLYQPLQGCDSHDVVIYLHGGGWCLGNIATHDAVCSHLAALSHRQVISVEYRLAPEHPFPYAVNDAQDMVEYVLNEQAWSQGQIYLAGDSAGGNLAAVTALSLEETYRHRLAGLVLVYPAVLAVSEAARTSPFGEGYMLDQASLEWFYARYLGNEADPLHPRVSPLLNAQLSALPRTLLVTAEYDPLTPDCLSFLHALKDSGVSVEHEAVPGVIHGYLTLGKQFPESMRTISRISQFICFQQ